MIINGIHWFFATAIAVAVHLAGILWLSLPMSIQLPELEPAGKGIVVTLGSNTRTAAAKARPVEPETNRQPTEVGDVVPEQAEPVVEAAESAIPEASVPSDPHRDLIDLESLDAAKTIEPESVQAMLEEQPETAEARVLNEVTLLESETVTAQDLSVIRPQPETVDPRDLVTTLTIPGASVPTELAEDTSLPDEAEIRDAAEEIRALDIGAAPVRSDTTEVEEVAIAGIDQEYSIPRSKVVEAKPVDEQTVIGGTMTVSRLPAVEVEQVDEPNVSEAARPLTIDLQELEDNVGTGGVSARYAGVIKGWLQKNMHYPRAARLAGQEGQVVVRFVIDRRGKVQFITLESGSGHPLLDREAREMIERGDPFPAMPKDMPGQSLEVRVPASFHVRDETLTKRIPPINLE